MARHREMKLTLFHPYYWPPSVLLTQAVHILQGWQDTHYHHRHLISVGKMGFMYRVNKWLTRFLFDYRTNDDGRRTVRTKGRSPRSMKKAGWASMWGCIVNLWHRITIPLDILIFCHPSSADNRANYPTNGQVVVVVGQWGSCSEHKRVIDIRKNGTPNRNRWPVINFNISPPSSVRRFSRPAGVRRRVYWGLNVIQNDGDDGQRLNGTAREAPMDVGCGKEDNLCVQNDHQFLFCSRTKARLWDREEKGAEEEVGGGIGGSSSS